MLADRAVMKFIDVESESKQEKLCFSLIFSSGKEAPEIPVLLQYTEGSLYLNGTILPQYIPVIRCNSLSCFGFLSSQCF